ncbi:MAG: hypothetical protein ACXWRU_18600, partial [Pseudobdellovibrionaceae bacterium]
MPKTILLLIEILEISFLRRLAIASLLPNLLVWGFKINNLDTTRNTLWTSIVGPYWFYEKLVIAILIIAVVAEISWPALKVLSKGALDIGLTLFSIISEIQVELQPSKLDPEEDPSTQIPLSDEETALQETREKATREARDRKHQEELAQIVAEKKEREEDQKRKEHEEWLRKNPPPVTKADAKAQALREITG